MWTLKQEARDGSIAIGEPPLPLRELVCSCSFAVGVGFSLAIWWGFLPFFPILPCLLQVPTTPTSADLGLYV